MILLQAWGTPSYNKPNLPKRVLELFIDGKVTHAALPNAAATVAIAYSKHGE